MAIKTFGITGKIEENGCYNDAISVDFRGSFDLSEDNTIKGYVKDTYGPCYQSIITGVYLEQENILGITKIPTSPYLAPMLLLLEDINKEGQWFRFNPKTEDFYSNGRCAGLLKVSIIPEYTNNTASDQHDQLSKKVTSSNLLLSNKYSSLLTSWTTELISK